MKNIYFIYNYYSDFIYKLYKIDYVLLDLEVDVVERGIVPHLQHCSHVGFFRQLNSHHVSVLPWRIGP